MRIYASMNIAVAEITSKILGGHRVKFLKLLKNAYLDNILSLSQI
jgi:hypothetical protein